MLHNTPKDPRSFAYDEVRSEKTIIAAAQPSVQLTVAGNNAYDKLMGYMLIICNADGTPFVGDATVSMTTSPGVIMLPPQPYHCIRPSYAEKHEDRIIKVSDTKGFGQDFRFLVESANLAAQLKVTVVCYFTRKK